MSTPDLVFIGCPSLDRVERPDTTRDSVGGAAFISALAARLAGAQVGLVARIPTALPDEVAAVFGPGGLERGGLKTATGALPRFTIRYDGNDRATYSEVDNGMELGLCAADVPDAWLSVPWVHIAAIGGDSTQQLRVLDDLRARGFSGRISAGTYRRMVVAEPEHTRSLLGQSDLFFLNEEEFALLFPKGPPPNHAGVICITRGPRGVTVLGGPAAGDYGVSEVPVVDATGAGDAFCGGFLAGLVQGSDPVSTGSALAARVLSGPGCAPLLGPVCEAIGPRVEVDPSRIAQVAGALRSAAQTSAFHFADPPHLPPGHPAALSMLCIATLHQYGFWEGDERGWQGPMYAELDGVRYKGSDFIWAAFTRAASTEPDLLAPARMAADPELFSRICTDDQGRCPVPMAQSHSSLHQAHGQAMGAHWPGGYPALIDASNHSDSPIATLVQHLADLPGYADDPLLKKANLLAIILANRPEGFLRATDIASVTPIVDYHLMRGCLRTGCVRITDPDLARRIDARAWVDGPEEAVIRQACFEAIDALVAQSGTSVAAVDGFFFKNGRSVCLELEPPRCEACALAPSCAQLGLTFQPVFRTTDY